MEQQVAWGAGKPGTEDVLLSVQSDTDAYYGRLNHACSLLDTVRSGGRDLSKSLAGFLSPVAFPYELGQAGTFINYVYSAYVRGQAYLLAHNGTAAAAEFQKLLDHRGIVGNFLTGSLAHLQIGRAYALQGDTAKAKAAYQEFFALWKDADPDIPILKQAKAEYARLQ